MSPKHSELMAPLVAELQKSKQILIAGTVDHLHPAPLMPFLEITPKY